MFSGIGGASWYVWQKNTDSGLSVKNESPAISTYEDCVSSGAGYPIVDSHVPTGGGTGSDLSDFKMTTYACQVTDTNKKFYAKFNRCNKDNCSELESASLSFCNDAYKSLRNEGTHGEYFVKNVEDIHLKDNYARANIKCYRDGDTIQTVESLIVFFKKENNKWSHLLTILPGMTCADMDGMGIPLAIAGSCYDTGTGGYRGPKS